MDSFHNPARLAHFLFINQKEKKGCTRLIPVMNNSYRKSESVLEGVYSRLITHGPVDEIVFRTKGIPPLFTHWWHFVRSGSSDLWGIVLGLPDAKGVWKTCMVSLDKIK